MRANKKDDISSIARQIKRRERYERDKERKINAANIFCRNDDDFAFSQAAYQKWLQAENEQKLYQVLYAALDDLKLLDPAGYKLISEYYLEGGMTFTEIGKKYGISRQACTKRIHKCLSMLKVLVELHKLKG